MFTEYRLKRLEKGLRQADLETLTGISQPKISLIERGYPPDPAEKVLIERALDIDSQRGDRGVERV